MTSPQQIRIEGLFISPGHNFFGHYGQPPGDHHTVELREIECVAGRGIQGDRFFDFKNKYKGQITFFPRKSLIRSAIDSASRENPPAPPAETSSRAAWI